MANKLDELQQQIEELQKQREELLETEKESAIEQINSMIKAFDIKPRELIFRENLGQVPPLRNKTRSVPMKYSSGHDSWSGRGRKPKWVEAHLRNGGTLEDLLIR